MKLKFGIPDQYTGGQQEWDVCHTLTDSEFHTASYAIDPSSYITTPKAVDHFVPSSFTLTPRLHSLVLKHSDRLFTSGLKP